MKVVNKAGFPFTLPRHLSPNLVPITIPYDGRVYEVPDAIIKETSLGAFLTIVELPKPLPPKSIIVEKPKPRPLENVVIKKEKREEILKTKSDEWKLKNGYDEQVRKRKEKKLQPIPPNIIKVDL